MGKPGRHCSGHRIRGASLKISDLITRTLWKKLVVGARSRNAKARERALRPSNVRKYYKYRNEPTASTDTGYQSKRLAGNEVSDDPTPKTRRVFRSPSRDSRASNDGALGVSCDTDGPAESPLWEEEGDNDDEVEALRQALAQSSPHRRVTMTNEPTAPRGSNDPWSPPQRTVWYLGSLPPVVIPVPLLHTRDGGAAVALPPPLPGPLDGAHNGGTLTVVWTTPLTWSHPMLICHGLSCLD